MVARILPASEWHRVNDRAVGRLCRAGDESSVQVLVVEDEGRIVCSWAFVLMMHLEGLEIDPDYRGRAWVGRALLGLMRQAGRALGLATVETGADTPEIETLLRKAGGEPRPYQPFVLPIESAAPYRRAGRRFHAALERLPGHRVHPEDPAHDIAVGRLLLGADHPGAAVQQYNDWAASAGYEVIESWNPTAEGGYAVCFGSEVIRVNAALQPVEVFPCQ